ncbi:MAG: hypothetical protein ACETWK_01070 [Candidatus Aminicenantaceae bacterium]
MKSRIIAATIILAIVSPLLLRAKNKEIIIGISGGYSIGTGIGYGFGRLEAHYPKYVYFKEKNKAKYSMGVNIQYFLSQSIGFQGELSYQKATYFSHLEWYGMRENVLDPQTYFEINYLEEPYQKSWGIYSFTFSILAMDRPYIEKKTYAYACAGVGLYFITGDKDKVLNRFMLGSQRISTGFRVGVGLKHRLTSRINLNLRIFGVGINRRSTGRQYTTYTGPYQFSAKEYLGSYKIVRAGGLVKTASYFSLDISLEYRI